MTGLNSSSGVIIVTDTGRFKRVEDRKCASIIGTLLNVVFDIVKLLGL